MEGKILVVIGFEFMKITSIIHFEAINRFAKLQQKDYFLGRYLLEAILFDLDMKKYSNATVAFALIFFIRKLRCQPGGGG